jgi:hypothetical protein
MILDVAPIEPAVNNIPAIIIVSISIVIVLTVGIISTVLLKKKNAK